MMDDRDLKIAEAVMAFLTSEVKLPNSDAPAGTIWLEERNGWLYPWRITRPGYGYPCGEPRSAD